MAGNTVTLTFAGDAASLQRAAKASEEALGKVGKAAHDVDRDLGASADRIDSRFGNVRRKLLDFGEGIVDAFQGAAAKLPGVIGSLPPQGQAIAAVLTVGLAATLAPAIGAAITGAVLFAVGGQALIMGIKAAAKNPRVKAAFGELKTEASKVFEDFGKPFVEPLVRAADTFKDTLDNLKPAIGRISEAIAPVIDKLAPGLAGFLEKAMPGIEEAVKGSVPLFEVLAEKLPKIGEAVSDFFSSIAESGPSAAQFFGDLFDFIAGTIRIIGRAIGWLASFYAANRRAITDFRDAALEVGRWFRDVLWGKWIKGAWNAIKDKASDVADWMSKIPGRLKGAFSGIANTLSAPFKSAFNKIADAWNNTIGSLSWHFPGAFGAGAFTIDVPNIPRFHTGGRVPGMPGQEVPIMALAGETVLPAGRPGGGDIVIRSGGSQLDDLLVEILSRAIGRRGGNVQTVLGGRNAA